MTEPVMVDLDFYWTSVGIVLTVIAGHWGFRRLKTLISGR